MAAARAPEAKANAALKAPPASRRVARVVAARGASPPGRAGREARPRVPAVILRAREVVAYVTDDVTSAWQVVRPRPSVPVRPRRVVELLVATSVTAPTDVRGRSVGPASLLRTKLLHRATSFLNRSITRLRSRLIARLRPRPRPLAIAFDCPPAPAPSAASLQLFVAKLPLDASL